MYNQNGGYPGGPMYPYNNGQYPNSYPGQYQNPYPYPNNYTPMPSMEEMQPPRKKNKTKLIIIGVAIAVILIVLVLFFIFSSSGIGKNKNNAKYDELTLTDAFFLSNGKRRYALFNESGKQLSEFVYKKVGDFYGGVARVETHDGQVGIIKEDGSFLVNYSEDKIDDYRTLFLINHSKLINYRGEKIMEGDNLVVNTFDDPSLFLIQSGKEESFTILNYRGKKIDTLEADKYSKSKVVDGYVTLISSTSTHLYNVDTGEKILETDGAYCVNKIKGNTIILSSCSEADRNRDFKVVKKGKVLYSIGKFICGSLDIMDDENIMCDSAKIDTNHFVVDGVVREELVSGYHSQSEYVLKNDTGLIFYVAGQERYRVDCATIYGSYDEGYILRGYNSGVCAGTGNGFAYHAKTGEKLTDYFYKVSDWDNNNYSIVASDSETYYLLNKEMDRVSEYYRILYSAGNLYIGMTNEGVYVLFDKDHTILEKGFRSFKNTDYSDKKDSYVVLSYDNGIMVYNSKTGEKVSENGKGNNPKLAEHYYTIGNSYFSYTTGVEFYTL